MTHSRFLALPKSYATSSGDPRGYVGASVAERTIFRYQMGVENWGAVPFTGDPVRYDGRPYITTLLMAAAADVPDGTLVQIVDGFGGNDTYEFRADGGPVTPGNILVDISADTTAASVANRFANTVSSDGTAQVSAAIFTVTSVRFTQHPGFYGGRTGFSGVLVGTGLVAFQSLPFVFVMTETQTGFDPLLVVPGIQGPRPVWLGVNAAPIFLVT